MRLRVPTYGERGPCNATVKICFMLWYAGPSRPVFRAACTMETLGKITVGYFRLASPGTARLSCVVGCARSLGGGDSLELSFSRSAEKLGDETRWDEGFSFKLVKAWGVGDMMCTANGCWPPALQIAWFWSPLKGFTAGLTSNYCQTDTSHCTG